MTEEDWKLVTDRSLKKRIQNRVAQRTYRNRMKQRVEELEKEVNDYRRRAQEQQTAAGDRQDGNGNHGVDQSARSINSSNDDKSQDKSSSSGSSCRSSYAIDMDDVRAGGARLGGPQTRLPQSEPVLQPQFLAQAAHSRAPFPPQLSSALGQPYTSTLPGFTSPPLTQPYSPTPEWPWPNASNSVYRDSLSQQPLTGTLPLVHKLPPSLFRDETVKGNITAEFESQAGFPALGARGQVRSEQQGAGSDASYHISPNTTYIVQPGDMEQSHLPPADRDIDLTASADRSEASSTDAASPSSSASMVSGGPLGDLHDKLLAQVLENNSSNEQQLRIRCLEDRFEFIRLCVASAGFSSFDAMVSQYYTADFSHESIVSREQRSSRHSQLPLLLTKLRKNVKTWTQWEAHGYQYEIIKSAESIIRAERNDFVATQTIYANALSELERLQSGATDGADNGSLSRAFRTLTKMFQDTVRTYPILTIWKKTTKTDEQANASFADAKALGLDRVARGL
ncbi:hypothetical protein K469DRAFT_697354 [Zopfia rhizophila CBS 207.26]|uniref:BZIP domain-containing protein n=1 Tax=Zopfia rhizophila CBS 207.26 TaxID=1314779 RepID=A0A6A6DDT3_9PEZI|nr:hypothetical protein K469DRAFT_697354 [Zopfia rhizophila CBS 207.26]